MSELVAAELAVVRGGATLVEDVSATFASGEVTVVVGENGAGKSTLLDALTGLRAPTRGGVGLDGEDLSALAPRERARRIASLGQGDVYAPDLVVASRVGHGLAARRGPDALLDDVALARVRVVAKQLGVDGLLERRLFSLSGGERRRVDVARALVDDEATAYLLDEPHAGVDAKHQRLVSAAIRERAQAGRIVVVTVHDLSVALDLADRVLGLRDGRVVVDEAPNTGFSPESLERVYGVRGGIVQTPSGARGIVLEG
jgi:iron complex transport system ATP-binding protein